MELKGIDVSHNNGRIDWNKIKAAGIDFAIIRTGFGKEHPKQLDTEFERNYSECKRLGIPVGAYHYSYADSSSAAEKEAEFVLKLIKGKQFEYPVFFDIEEKVHISLSKAKCTEIVRAFCQKLEEAGFWAGVYSFDSFFSSHLDKSIQGRYSVWTARVENVKPAFCQRYDIWQNSWKGKVDGSSKDTDSDICYKDFPTLIKKAGKNGYGKIAEPAYTLTVSGLTKQKAEELGRLSGKKYSVKEEL